MITFSFTSNSCIRSQTMGWGGGGCYCSTMCQYNKWNYPHRDSIIMPCIDQWTLTGSRSCGCQDLPFSWVSFSLITSSLISFRLAVTFSSVNQPVRGFRGMVKSWMGSWKTKVTDYQLGRWSHKAWYKIVIYDKLMEEVSVSITKEEWGTQCAWSILTQRWRQYCKRWDQWIQCTM